MINSFPHVSPAFETKYKFISKIGQGGMGEVFKVEQRATGQILAIKFFKQLLFGNISAQNHFIQEAKFLHLNSSSLIHKNLVVVVDSGREGDHLYIAFEFVEGITLRKAIENNQYPSLKDIIKVLVSICNGLAFLHQKQIVHLDIKPENIMIQNNGDLKIIDLGISLSLNQRKNANETEGQILGTPGYMSPEQCQDEKITYSSDLYSVGVIFYEMLTGMPPFWGNVPNVIKSHIFNEPPPLASHNLVIHEAFSKLLYQLLEKDPAKRPRSALYLVRQLKNLLRDKKLKIQLSKTLASNPSSNQIHNASSNAKTVKANPISNLSRETNEKPQDLQDPSKSLPDETSSNRAMATNLNQPILKGIGYLVLLIAVLIFILKLLF